MRSRPSKESSGTTSSLNLSGNKALRRNLHLPPKISAPRSKKLKLKPTTIWQSKTGSKNLYFPLPNMQSRTNSAWRNKCSNDMSNWLTSSSRSRRTSLSTMGSTRSAESRVPSFPAVKSRELQLQEPWSKTLRFWFWTKPPALSTRTVRRSCSRPSTELWKEELQS